MPARLEVVSFEVLSKLFHLPMRDVMDKLRVSAPTLKKMCRQHNIQRWPHRKLQSIEKNLQKISKFHPTSNSEKARKSAKLAKLLRKRSTIFRIPVPKVVDEDATIQALLEEHGQISLENPLAGPSDSYDENDFVEKTQDELPSAEAAQALLGMSKDVQQQGLAFRIPTPPSSSDNSKRSQDVPKLPEIDRRPTYPTPMNPAYPAMVSHYYPPTVPLQYQPLPSPRYYQTQLQPQQPSHYSQTPQYHSYPIHQQPYHYSSLPRQVPVPSYPSHLSRNPPPTSYPSYSSEGISKHDHLALSNNANFTLPPIHSLLKSLEDES